MGSSVFPWTFRDKRGGFGFALSVVGLVSLLFQFKLISTESVCAEGELDLPNTHTVHTQGLYHDRSVLIRMN